MILYAFSSSRRDLSFETHFEFFVFQASVRPSVRPSVDRSVRPSVCSFVVCPSLHPFVRRLSVRACIRPSTRTSCILKKSHYKNFGNQSSYKSIFLKFLIYIMAFPVTLVHSDFGTFRPRRPRFSPTAEIFANGRDFRERPRFSPTTEIFADGQIAFS